MPTNLPPEVRALEYQYLNAKTIDEKIRILEQIIAKTPKHKGTEKYLGQIRRRLKKLKEQKEKLERQRKRSTVALPKDFDFRVSIVGWYHVGKTAILNFLAKRSTEYEYFRVGTARIKDVPIQFVECPGFLSSEVLQVLASSDVILVLLSAKQDLDSQLREVAIPVIQKFLESKKILVLLLGKLDIDKITSTLLASIEDPGATKNLQVRRVLSPEELKRLPDWIYSMLGIIRVYTKEPGKKPSEKPLVLPRGSTVADVARRIHKDFLRRFRYARVWGKSVKFPGQQVGLDHQLCDGDVVEIYLK